MERLSPEKSATADFDKPQEMARGFCFYAISTDGSCQMGRNGKTTTADAHVKFTVHARVRQTAVPPYVHTTAESTLHVPMQMLGNCLHVFRSPVRPRHPGLAVVPLYQTCSTRA